MCNYAHQIHHNRVYHHHNQRRTGVRLPEMQFPQELIRLQFPKELVRLPQEVGSGGDQVVRLENQDSPANCKSKQARQHA